MSVHSRNKIHGVFFKIGQVAYLKKRDNKSDRKKKHRKFFKKGIKECGMMDEYKTGKYEDHKPQDEFTAVENSF